MPPWLRGSEISSMTGTVARKGQENGRMATPSAIAATGDSSRQATAVSPAAERNMSGQAGRWNGPGPGQSGQGGVQRGTDAQDGGEQQREPGPGTVISVHPAQIVEQGQRGHRRDLPRE